MTYTQAPSLTKEEIESLLKEAKFARFCSFNEDGTIHATPVWFKYENGHIIVGTPSTSRKARNIRHNNNVTVLIDVEGPPTRGVIIYGQAKLKHLSKPEELMSTAVSLFEKYMDRKQAETLAKGISKIAKWVMISVKPKRIASFDYAKDETWRTAYKG